MGTSGVSSASESWTEPAAPEELAEVRSRSQLDGPATGTAERAPARASRQRGGGLRHRAPRAFPLPIDEADGQGRIRLGLLRTLPRCGRLARRRSTRAGGCEDRGRTPAPEPGESAEARALGPPRHAARPDPTRLRLVRRRRLRLRRDGVLPVGKPEGRDLVSARRRGRGGLANAGGSALRPERRPQGIRSPPRHQAGQCAPGRQRRLCPHRFRRLPGIPDESGDDSDERRDPRLPGPGATRRRVFEVRPAHGSLGCRRHRLLHGHRIQSRGASAPDPRRLRGGELRLAAHLRVANVSSRASSKTWS